MAERNVAAIFIDFENIFYFLKNQLPEREDSITAITGMVRSLKQHLVDVFNEHALSMDAYADFDRIGAAQSEMYLLGVETHNVLGTEHKNAADMRLCIDTLDTLYNRPEINSFVLVAGDRDYIPVIQYLKKRNRIVRVVGFPMSVSGDLLTIVGNDLFIDATQFVPALLRAQQERPGEAASVTSSSLAMDFEKYETQAAQVLLTHFKNKAEVWLTPYLHKLRAELSELTEQERKQLISRLVEKGVFKIEKRPGVPNDFSVLVMNWSNVLVRMAYS